MSFGEFGIFPLGVANRGLYGALAIIQIILLVITGLTIVNVLWMCLGLRKRSRAPRSAHHEPAAQAQREQSSAPELELLLELSRRRS